MQTKTTPKINSLPPELRAIADDMLSAKFPEKRLGVKEWTTTNTSAVPPLTSRTLQEMFDKVKDLMSEPWEIPQPWITMKPRANGETEYFRKMYENVMVDRMKYGVDPMWVIDTGVTTV